MYKGKIVVRLSGGLGNQLFMFAAAKQFSIRTNKELLVDEFTGFAFDHKFKRSPILGSFGFPYKKAPWYLYPLSFSKLFDIFKFFLPISRINTFNNMNDPFNYIVYIDGYWQSQSYFLEIESNIRQSYRNILIGNNNAEAYRNIILKSVNSVAVHVRRFDLEHHSGRGVIGREYYKNAMEFLISQIGQCNFYVFSDRPEEVRKFLSLEKYSMNYINEGFSDIEEFHLMMSCDHFIIGDSTFSWWAAWLGVNLKKTVCFPKLNQRSNSKLDFPMSGWR